MRSIERKKGLFPSASGAGRAEREKRIRGEGERRFIVKGKTEENHPLRGTLHRVEEYLT